MLDSDALLSHLSELPFLTQEVPPITGILKRVPEDFCVEEVPSYVPCGEGEHLYVFFEKRGLNTPEAVRTIGQKLGLSGDEAGFAGLKDRQAVTRQWASFHHPDTPEAHLLEAEGIRILQVARHTNKLRTGHLRGNRFTLRLCEVPPEHDHRVTQVLERLREVGLPNYYGEQRFGHLGRNLAGAARWIVGGERAPQKPFLRKLFVSTLQSALFNAWLGARVGSGELASANVGDVMRKEENGGVFVCEDANVDGPRVAAWDISPTGPMFGARMRPATDRPGALEEELLARWGVSAAHFERVRKCGEGTRRVARVRPEGFKAERQGADLMLQFELPKGSYATVLIAELMKSRTANLHDDV